MIQSRSKEAKREIEYKQEMGALVVRKCNTLSDLLTEYVSLYGKENGHYPLMKGM